MPDKGQGCCFNVHREVKDWGESSDVDPITEKLFYFLTRVGGARAPLPTPA